MSFWKPLKPIVGTKLVSNIKSRIRLSGLNPIHYYLPYTIWASWVPVLLVKKNGNDNVYIIEDVKYKTENFIIQNVIIITVRKNKCQVSEKSTYNLKTIKNNLPLMSTLFVYFPILFYSFAFFCIYWSRNQKQSSWKCPSLVLMENGNVQKLMNSCTCHLILQVALW